VRKICSENSFFCKTSTGVITLKPINLTLAAAGLIAGLLATQIGCVESGNEPVTGNPALASPVPEGMVRGTVLETMNSGGYTYVFIETDQDQRWVAARQTAVAIGDVVQSFPGMPMSEFTSKTLNRTFDIVYFVDVVHNLSAPAAEAADNNVVELKSGQNIAYLYSNKDSIATQTFSLRGKVVKYNEGILGWNFIHIQDGSGDAADGNNDLTVTSKNTTAVGETVVVTGTMILDRDFGAGYKFPLLMEDANIETE
jgi:hypothetical protein